MGALFSSPAPRGPGESRDTPAPAGGPVSPQTPVGPERARQAAGLLVLSLPEREEPQSLACISSAGGAGGRPAPAPGRVCSGCPARRCCQAARVTAHTSRPRSPGSPTAGSRAQPGCPECLPCWSQHRLCGCKAALDCAGGGSILPGEMITATAQLQGTSRWPSAHPKSFASASSGNFPRACLSRPLGGHADLPPGPRCCHGNSKLTRLGGSVDTCDLCVLRSVTTLCSRHACLILGGKTPAGSQQESKSLGSNQPEPQRHRLPREAQWLVQNHTVRALIWVVLIHPLADPGDKSLGPASPGPSRTRDPSPAPPPPKWTGFPPPGSHLAPAVHTALIIQGLLLCSGKPASLPTPPSGPGLGSGSSKGHQRSRWDQGIGSSWRHTAQGKVVQTRGTTSSGGHRCSQQSLPFTNQQPPCGGAPHVPAPREASGPRTGGRGLLSGGDSRHARRQVVHVEGTYHSIKPVHPRGNQP